MWWNSIWAISNPKRWCCESAALNMPAHLENSATATGLEKVSFHSNSKERQYQRMFKVPHNRTHLTHYKVMLKILQARLQQYLNHELPHVQAGFRKGRGTRDQIANIHWITEKARQLQKKTSTSALLAIPKPLTVWTTTNCGKFLKRWEYQTTLPASWEICMQVKKQQLELDMEQCSGSKLRKECIKLYIVTVLIKLIGRVQHVKCWIGWSTCWNQDCQEKYQ